VLVVAALLVGCPRGAERPAGRAQPAPARPAACTDHDPLRRPFFGDLHVHTARSFDAWVLDTRATPDDAYRFARGERIAAPPLDAAGRGARTLRLARPLDFAAVTDHSEWFGEVALCTTPGSADWDTRPCRVYRGEEPPPAGTSAYVGRLLSLTGADPGLPGARSPTAILERSPALCGGDGCEPATASVWQEMQEASARHDTPCSFTTFNAYEYSASPQSTNLHRNVVFRNAIVPPLPVSWIDAPAPHLLWERLAAECLDVGTGCDALAIPHNPNLSNGRLFTPDDRRLGPVEQQARARLRARVERLVEVMQSKGASECRRGMWRVVGEDEACDFEQLRSTATPDCDAGVGVGAMGGKGCTSRLDFVRYVLAFGLGEAERLGINPYRLGIVASTDTHLGDPGNVDEAAFPGVDGVRDATVEARLGPAVVTENPGGLAGVWAEENTRDAIFDALSRRETFGTSGPRISPRFFGGWAFPASLCDDAALVARGYAGGVPMGGDLPRPPDDATAPVFVVSALADPGTADAPGGRLERVQIVKGWTGSDGRIHQAVYDVAAAAPAAGVDAATCASSGGGATLLCGVWRDHDFDVTRRAVYYARILETPSCRWSSRQCLALPAASRPPSCPPEGEPELVRERAWTSPIWYTPASEETA
jgi:hypothetical protein